MDSLSTQPYDETELLSLLKSGNQKAHKELHRRFAPKLLVVLLLIVRDQQQAEDLLQDSFLKIWLNLSQYDPSKGRLFTWMHSIVRHTALSYLKAIRLRQTQSIEAIPLEQTGTVLPSDQFIGLAEWIHSTLREEHRQVIDLVYFQHYTHPEVADELGLPLGTVKTRVRRALQILRTNA